MAQSEKLNCKDAFFHYGIEIPRRFRPSEKDFFLRKAALFFKEHAYPVSYITNTKKGIKAANLIVGDPQTANTIVLARYNTPAHNFGNPYLYYPFDGTASVQSRILPTYTPAIIAMLVIIYTLWQWRAFLNFSRHPFISSIMTIVLILATISSYILTGSIGNAINLNDNTSGVVGIMLIAQELNPAARKHVAFILTDSNGHAGDALNRTIISDIDHKNIIILDCIGHGKENRIGYQRASKKLASEIAGDLAASTQLVDGSALRFSSFSYYPSGVLISRTSGAGHVVENSGTKKDAVVDTEAITDLSLVLSRYLNRIFKN